MNIRLANLIVPQGATVSNALSYVEQKNMEALSILSPAALDGGTVFTLEISASDNPGSGDWVTLQSDGSDVALSAGKSLTLVKCPFMSLRVKASVAVANDRTFQVVGADK